VPTDSGSEHDVTHLAPLASELHDSIASLLEAKRNRAALILLFSSIDILGALAARGGIASRSSFKAWCDQYLRPQQELECSSEELYSARCGLLHNMSPKTSLTTKGLARRFIYVRDVLGGPIRPRSPDPDIHIVNPGALWQAFRSAVRDFTTDVANNDELAGWVSANLRGIYVTSER